jgi:hypothetical protein
MNDMQLQLDPPLLVPLPSPQTLDPTELNSRLKEIQRIQAKRPLEPSENREGLTLIQIIRGTLSTSGPKGKGTRKKAAGKMTLDDFEASLGLSLK